MEKKKAFSLIEIIFVLGLIGVLVFYFLPVFSSFLNSTSLKSFSLQILEDLKTARQRAKFEKNTYQAIFYPRADQSTAYYGIYSKEIGAPKFNLQSTRYLPPDISFDKMQTFIFSPSGSPPPAGFGTLIISHAKGRTMKIVFSSSGRIRLE